LGAEGLARAIALGDARAIQAANGVGPKLAQRIILELKAKAPGVMAISVSLTATAQADDGVIETQPTKPARRPAPSPEITAAVTRAGYTADALSALLNLGYSQGDAAQAVATISAATPEADTATLIRASLKLLAPR
jgi:Holliday junction DNA helicase RuvA